MSNGLISYRSRSQNNVVNSHSLCVYFHYSLDYFRNPFHIFFVCSIGLCTRVRCHGLNSNLSFSIISNFSGLTQKALAQRAIDVKKEKSKSSALNDICYRRSSRRIHVWVVQVVVLSRAHIVNGNQTRNHWTAFDQVKRIEQNKQFKPMRKNEKCECARNASELSIYNRTQKKRRKSQIRLTMCTPVCSNVSCTQCHRKTRNKIKIR